MPQPIHGQGVSQAAAIARAGEVGKRKAPGGGSFARTLAKATPPQRLRFSAHAQDRLASRNIQLDETDLDQLARATDQAAAKGARDSLVLLNDLGLIVNIPTRTVVTALDAERMQNGVFTNIDSTVIIRDK